MKIFLVVPISMCIFAIRKNTDFWFVLVLCFIVCFKGKKHSGFTQLSRGVFFICVCRYKVLY